MTPIPFNQPESCLCTLGDAPNQEQLAVSGYIHFIFTINMKKFLKHKKQVDMFEQKGMPVIPSGVQRKEVMDAIRNRNLFEQYRGGNAFYKAISSISSSQDDVKSIDINQFIANQNTPNIPQELPGFTLAYEENTRILEGHAYSIFRGHFTRDWLTATYRINHLPQQNFQLGEVDFCQIRLSRLGLFEVKISRRLGSGNLHCESLLDVIQRPTRSIQSNANVHLELWKLAVECANQFISAFNHRLIIIAQDTEKLTEILFEAVSAEQLRYYPPYMVYKLEEVTCLLCNRHIAANEFYTAYFGSILAMLEGVLIHHPSDGSYHIPAINSLRQSQLQNLGSWDNELCVFTSERCLIYYEQNRILLPFSQPTGGSIDYGHYWEFIIRGVEHSVSVRAALQIIESNTTEELDHIPVLTRMVTDDEINTTDTQAIRDVGRKVSDNLNILARLRDISVATSIYRPSFAIEKFSHLNDGAFKFQSLLTHIERNIDELNNSLQFFMSVSIEDFLDEENDKLNRTAIVISAIAILLTAPSFIKDFTDYLGIDWTKHQMSWPNLNEAGIPVQYFLGILIIGLLLVYLLGVKNIIGVIFKRVAGIKLLEFLKLIDPTQHSSN